MNMRTTGALGLAIAGVATMLSAGTAAADPAPPYVDLQAFGYVSCGGPLPDRPESNSLIDHGWVTNHGPGTAYDVRVWFNGGVSRSAGMLAPGESLQIEQVVPSWGCPFRAISVKSSTSTYDINSGNNWWVARN
ncbi:hypothetical protein [Tsukamurella paurometabola]|uniref:Uncharacterized protein n=1 Tax=Tsukamurella paurometabola TaxID=2061 RepID=A0A3P8L885_TSUPA|nr:hypothetical protein [Tsukamurella paurometabola]UEA82875.1 hypothetical protein LK411_21350 [Tsukamurella paurometabola]VDR39951.1 Uncharacterised protein [Tsukamurella paurometabola]